MAHYYFITGASQGIGAALYRELMKHSENRVTGIARKNREAFPSFIESDLTDQKAYLPHFKKWLETLPETAQSVNLINNAGSVEPIEQVGALDPLKTHQSLLLNIEAPLLLSNLFVETLQDRPFTRRILNISSGAARNPYSGWSIYCTTKAAIDHFSRTFALEQSEKPFPIQIASVAPGVIDTPMQSIIRQSSEEAFPSLNRFVTLKESGGLKSAKETAKELIQYLHNDALMSSDPIADLRNLPK